MNNHLLGNFLINSICSLLNPKYLSKTVGDGVSHILFSTPGVGLAYGVQTSTDLVNWVDEPTIRSTGNTYIFTHNHDGNNFVRMSKK